MAETRIAVVVPAAGASRRYQSEPGIARSKLDEDLGGRPLLHRTVEAFANHDRVDQVVVAGPHEDEAFAAFQLRHGDKLALLGATLCRGGRTHRWQSVAAALEQVKPEMTHIAVHDAARPCVRRELIDRVFEAAASDPAVVPAVAVADTIKRAGEAREAAGEDPLAAILGGGQKRTVRRVEETLDRRHLFAAQTPQVFEAGLLRRAYEAFGALGEDQRSAALASDDAALVERLGETVTLVEGDAHNIKVTRGGDIAIARAILGYSPPSDRPTHKRF